MKAELDHSVDTSSEGAGFFEGETGSQEGSIEKEPDEILDGLVGLILVRTSLEFLDDGVIWVDFHGLLGDHVSGHGSVTESLSLHDSFHIGGPAVFSGNEHARRLIEALSNNNFLDLVTKDFLDLFAKGLERSFLFFVFLLLVVGLLEFKSFLGAVLKLFAIELLKLLDDVLIDGVNHVEDFITTLAERLDERRSRDGSSGLTSDEVNILLAFFHTSNVVLEGREFFTRLGGVVSKERRELITVSRVFVDSELEVLSELLVELLEVFFVVSNFLEEIKALLDDVLLDDLEDLVVLEEFSGNVKREILRVYDTLDEIEILGDEIFAVVHDEDSTNVELNVVFLLLGFEEIEGSTLGDEENSSELELTFNLELLDSEMLFPVVGEGLVEVDVLFLGDVFRLAHPERLVLILLFEFGVHFFNFLFLLVLLFVFLFLNFDVVFLILFFRFLIVVFIIGDFLLFSLLNLKFNGESNELRVLLDKVLDSAFLKEFKVVVLHVEDDLSTTGKFLWVFVVVGDGESTTSRGFPSPLDVFIVGLGNNFDLLSDEISGVETDTELTNHRNISSAGECLHECLGSRLSDSSEIVDEFLLGHTNTRVPNGECIVGFIRDDSDSEVRLNIELGLLSISDGDVTDLVEGIRSVGDDFSKEDFLVGVEGIDDKSHQLLDIGLEGEVLSHCAVLL